MTDLLPANSTALERAISNAMDRAGAIPTPADTMWDPARIPAEYLPWLAWAASVDDWDPDWPEARKRAAIAASADWHRHKGTRPSVMAVLTGAGYPAAVLIEDPEMPRYGEEAIIGADRIYGPDDPSWADYWVRIPADIHYPEADRLAERLRAVAPARCRLRAIEIAPPHQHALGDPGYVYGPDTTYGDTYLYGGYDG